MRKLYLLISSILLSVLLNAQTLICKKISNYSSVTFSDNFYKSPQFFFRQDTLVVIEKFNLSLFTPHKQICSVDLKEYLPKEQKELIQNNYSYNYLLSEDVLVIRNKNHAFLFNLNQSKVVYKQTITLSENYGKHIYFKDSTLYFFSIYNYHPNDSQIPSGFISHNLRNGKEEQRALPFEFMSLTHMAPNDFIDFTEVGYILCDPLRYKLYEYDFNHRLKDSIVIGDNLFTTSNVSTFENTFPSRKVAQNASSFMDAMTAHLDSTDRIWTVNYLDENTLFIRLTRNSLRLTTTQGQLFYDHIWRREKEGWKLTQVKEISSFNTKQVLTEKDLWPYFFPGSKYTCSKGSLYYTVWSSSDTIFPQKAERFFGFDTKDRTALRLKLIEFKPE
jgi:hypothetical protein